jgi:hypothetical protein
VANLTNKHRCSGTHKKWERTTNTKEIQGIIRDYLENLEEMDKFLDTYDNPKLNKEDINHLNRLLTHNETEAAIVFQKRKV